MNTPPVQTQNTGTDAVPPRDNKADVDDGQGQQAQFFDGDEKVLELISKLQEQNADLNRRLQSMVINSAPVTPSRAKKSDRSFIHPGGIMSSQEYMPPPPAPSRFSVRRC